MRPRDIGCVYNTSSAGMLDSPPDQSCDEVYHSRNSQREKPAAPCRQHWTPSAHPTERTRRGRNDAIRGRPPRFADRAARPLATHETLESLRFPANLSVKILVGAVF